MSLTVCVPLKWKKVYRDSFHFSGAHKNFLIDSLCLLIFKEDPEYDHMGMDEYVSFALSIFSFSIFPLILLDFNICSQF